MNPSAEKLRGMVLRCAGLSPEDHLGFRVETASRVECGKIVGGLVCYMPGESAPFVMDCDDFLAAARAILAEREDAK